MIQDFDLSEYRYFCALSQQRIALAAAMMSLLCVLTIWINGISSFKQ